MVAEEKIAISYEAKGVGQFVKSTKDAEKALREEAKALDGAVLELRKRVVELKKSENPDKQLIRNLQLQAQAAKLNSQSLKANASAVKESATANKNLLSTIAGSAGLAIGYAALGAAVIGATTAIVKSADEYNTLQARIRSATDATGDYIGVSRELNKISQQTGTSLESNVELFQRLTFAADALGASNKEILQFADSVAKLGTISGASTQATQAGTLQLAQALSSGRVQAEEINSILENLPALAKRIEQGLGLLPGQLKNAVKDGKVLSKDVFQAILKQGEDINQEFEKLPTNLGRSLTSAQGAFDRFSNVLDKNLGVTQALSTIITGLANGFNFLADAIQGASLNLGNFLKNSPFKDANLGPILGQLALGPVGGALGQFAKIDSNSLTQAGTTAGEVSTKKGPGYNATGKDKKGKTSDQLARELAQKEQKLLQAINDRLNLELRAIDVKFDELTSGLGPFARPQDKNVLNIERTKAKGRATQGAFKSLLGTSVQSPEAQTDRRKSLDSLKLDIKDLKNAFTDLNNEQRKIKTERQIADSQQAAQIQLASIEQVRDREIAAGEEVGALLDQEFQNRTISINKYYEQKNKLIEGQIQIEKDAADQRIAILKARITEAEKINDEGAKRQAELEIDATQRAFEDTADNLRRQQDKLKQEQGQALGQASRDFGNGLQSAISTAIKEAFDGTGPLKALKNFANNLKNLVVGTLADAIAQGFRQSKAFKGVSDFFGSLFNKLSGNGNNAASPGLGLSGASIGKAGAAAAGIAISALGSNIAGQNRSTGRNLAGVGVGAAGGALAGAAIGSIVPVIGTAIGAVLGGAVGGTAAAAKSSGGAFAGKSKSALIGGLAGGGLGFLIGGFIGAAKRKREIERQQKIADELVNKALNGADQNNLIDLQSRRSALLGNNKGLTGSRVKTIRDGAAQLAELIKAREKSIAEALKEFEKQNRDLADQVALNDAKPFERAALERQIAIRQIEFDTAKLLEQFKDSEKAKTQILEQESLKRKLLQQEENEAAKQTVQDLADLLKQRDEVANSNVFQRAKSVEQIKKEAISNIDKDIAEAYLKLQGQLAAGATPGNTASLNQIIAQAGQLSGQQNTLNIVINEASNPAMVHEAITRAFAAFSQKIYGANVA